MGGSNQGLLTKNFFLFLAVEVASHSPVKQATDHPYIFISEPSCAWNGMFSQNHPFLRSQLVGGGERILWIQVIFFLSTGNLIFFPTHYSGKFAEMPISADLIFEIRNCSFKNYFYLGTARSKSNRTRKVVWCTETSVCAPRVPISKNT